MRVIRRTAVASVVLLLGSGALAGVTPQSALAAGPSKPINSPLCPSDPATPLVEPEALGEIHDQATDVSSADEADTVATGKGVVVALTDANDLAGNPNFTRPDGSHVVINAPSYTADDATSTAYGVASAIAAQGTVTYDFSKELPFAGLPTGCTFTITGDAVDSSLVDDSEIVTPPSADIVADQTEAHATTAADVVNAVRDQNANVIVETPGAALRPDQYAALYAANDAAVAAGVTVVVAAGDGGPDGTMTSPSTDPLVISVGATTTQRLDAQAFGDTDWSNDQIAPSSSGGTAPNNRMVDLVAPGYLGEAVCSPSGSGCPSSPATGLTQAFSGSAQAAAFTAGAAADVIQAYRDSHGGTTPTPDIVKQMLVSTATDLGAAADQQGGGMVNIDAAVRAAQQFPGTTDVSTTNPTPSLTVSPSQLDVSGAAGTTSDQSVTVYNPTTTDTTVSGSFRELGAATSLGSFNPEPVSAPNPSLPIPAEGATAAAPIQINVPVGLAQLDTQMIWPDAANNTLLSYELIDPNGSLVQQSYDSGSVSGATVPNYQQATVTAPVAGTWTVEFRWASGTGHLQSPPIVPGGYTGNLSFAATGQNYVTSAAAFTPVDLPADSSTVIDVPVTFPTTPGDHPESLQLSADDGATSSLAIARRTLVKQPTDPFTATFTGGDGSGLPLTKTFDIPVAADQAALNIQLTTPDASADDTFSYYLIDPSGDLVAEAFAPTESPDNESTLSASTTGAGTWELDVILDNTINGDEPSQVVTVNIGIPQTITFSEPTSGTVGDGADLASDASDSSGLPVSFAVDAANSTPSDACSISGTVVTYLHAGTCAVEGSQAGNTTYSPAMPVENDISVSKVTPIVTPTPDPVAGSVAGQSVTINTTVTNNATTAGPSGTVTLTVGGNSIGCDNLTLVSNAVSCTTTELPVGSDTISAAYSGDGDDNSTSGSSTYTVAKANTTTFLSVAGHGLAAQVSIVNPGAAAFSGTVTFAINGKTVGSADVDAAGGADLGYTHSGAATVTATYSGNDELNPSSDSSTVSNPKIAAHLSSAHPKTKYGWYRSPVTVTFTCTPDKNGSIVLGCPKPVTLRHNGADQTVTKTIHGHDGGIATVTTPAINIDLTKPTVSIKGIAPGRTYSSRQSVRCDAHDALSGVASCSVHSKVKGDKVTLTTTATDEAGNQTAKSTSYFIAKYFVVGAKRVDGRYVTKIGTAYQVEADVPSSTPPVYEQATPAGSHFTIDSPPMTKIGPHLWSVRIHITKSMSSSKHWVLGVLVHRHSHQIPITVTG